MSDAVRLPQTPVEAIAELYRRVRDLEMGRLRLFPLRGPDGSAAAPTYSFSGDTDTGIYRSAPGHLGFAIDGVGVVHLNFQDWYSSTTGGIAMRHAGGSAAAPTYSFAGDTDTGIYRLAANTLGFSAGGSEVGQLVSGVNGGHLNRGYRYGGTVQFTSSGTFSKGDYPGLRAVLVEVQGAGGAGGGASATGSGGVAYGGGGGAGGYARRFILEGHLGANETVTVGTGGLGVAGTHGNPGGHSSFLWLSGEVRGNGGLGGTRASITTGAGVNGTGGSGGTGTGGDLNISGSPGHPGMGITPGTALGGNGGSSLLGAGGLGQPQFGSGGNGLPAGGGYGGGGAGARNGQNQGSNRTGGAGADGIVIVHLYY